MWTAAHVAAIAEQDIGSIPVIGQYDKVPAIADLDVWDMWPLQHPNGDVVHFNDAVLWFALSSPRLPDPAARHAVAKIRVLIARGNKWTDCGNALPRSLSPGSREWSGSAVFNPDTQRLTLYFTAAGRADETSVTFEQRIFAASAALAISGDRAELSDWSIPTEPFASDDSHYVRVIQSTGAIGQIKAFRDPAFFRDPADGNQYLLFTGSQKQSTGAFNGVIGIAAFNSGKWVVLPPLVSADGLNNELERPHLVAKNGRYYLFWSTQRSVFAPDQPYGPTGLYGMVATQLFGPYRPLNGSGLVAANPPAEPDQAYSWWVLNTLEVTSFIDYWGLAGRQIQSDPVLARAQFGGTPAPPFRLSLTDDVALIVPPS